MLSSSVETDQGHLLLNFPHCNCSIPILLMASLGELLVWLAEPVCFVQVSYMWAKAVACFIVTV